MKLIDGKIVLETTNCCACSGSGVRPQRVTCPTCRGTRRGPRGGRGKCRGCYDGKVNSDTLTETCGRCHGAKTEPETRYDSVPAEIFKALNFRVVRNERGQWGFNESYLGLGYISCVTDYGTAWKRNNDAELIEQVKNDRGYTQALNICNEELTVCKEVVILVTRNGYKVKAVYGDENPADNSKADSQVRQMFDPRGLAVAEAMVAR